MTRATSKSAIASDDAQMVLLTAKILEQGEDLRELRSDLDEVMRALGVRRARAPRGWIAIKQAAHECGVSTETVRLWVLKNLVSGDRYGHQWFVDPVTLPTATGTTDDGGK